MKYIITTITAFSVLISFSSATPEWDVDFEGPAFVDGQAPPTSQAVAGQLNTEPTNEGASGANNSVFVDDNYTLGSTTMGTKVGVIQYLTDGPGTNVFVRFDGATADYTSPAAFTLEFDYLIGNITGTGNTLKLSLKNENNDDLISAFFKTDGDIQVLSDFAPNERFSSAWSSGQIQTFTGSMNASSDTFTLSIDGSVVGSVDLDYGGPVGSAGGLNNIVMNRGGQDVTWEGGFDNFTVVPEPRQTALGFGLVSWALLFGLRRRQL